MNPEIQCRHWSLSSTRAIESLGSQPTSLQSILILSFHLRLGLSIGLFPLRFLTETLYAFLDCSIHATCPAHRSRLNLRFLFMLGKEYNARSSALCNFLHSPVILLSQSQISSKHFILKNPFEPSCHSIMNAFKCCF